MKSKQIKIWHAPDYRIAFALIFILCACKEGNKLITTRDVLVNRTTYFHINVIDSIALEYTDIDSITRYYLPPSFPTSAQGDLMLNKQL